MAMQRSLQIIALGLACFPGLALADIFDEADITIMEYEVSGADLDAVSADMQQNGPQGYWAYTTWNVTWTPECETSVTADITMPVLADDADLDDDEVAEFERMADALLDHELGHVQVGLDFAQDVAAAGCPADVSDLHEYWLQVERDYDAETEHGGNEGVYLDSP